MTLGPACPLCCPLWVPGPALPVAPEIESVATELSSVLSWWKSVGGGRLGFAITGDTDFRREIQYFPGRDISRQDSDAKRNMVIPGLPGTGSF